MSTNNSDTGVWVGLKRCGCCVAVCVDDAKVPRADIEQTKREFLKDGLSVVYGTWDEWLTKYLPSLQGDCGHDAEPIPTRNHELF